MVYIWLTRQYADVADGKENKSENVYLIICRRNIEVFPEPLLEAVDEQPFVTLHWEDFF